MSAPVNLNRVRKAREKMKKRAEADENAVKFGRTKVEKDHAKAQAVRDARRLDGKKRER